MWIIQEPNTLELWNKLHFEEKKTESIYLLTPWCRVLLEKLTGLQLVKKFPAIHGTRRFITVLTSVRHLSLSWANPIQSTFLHPTSWRSILILSTHLRLGLPSGLLPSGFPTNTLYTPLSSPIRATYIYIKDRPSILWRYYAVSVATCSPMYLRKRQHCVRNCNARRTTT